MEKHKLPILIDHMIVQGERGLKRERKREEPSELVTDSSSAVCTQHAACKAPTPCLPTYRICGPTLSASSFSLSLTSALKMFSPFSPPFFSLSPPLAPPSRSAGLFFPNCLGTLSLFVPPWPPLDHILCCYIHHLLWEGGAVSLSEPRKAVSVSALLPPHP